MSNRRKLHLALCILKGLRVFHRKGIVHKDIKPDNIFIDSFNNAKIGDYGVMTHTNNKTSFYQTDFMTPNNFRPPEFITFSKDQTLQTISPAFDVY